MREYNRRSDNVNGYPSFSIRESFGFLYRNGTTGCWMVAEVFDQMNTNKGYLRTKSAAELPTQDGLTWQYQSSSRLRAVTGTWRDDRAIVCGGANKVTLTLNRHLKPDPYPKSHRNAK